MLIKRFSKVGEYNMPAPLTVFRTPLEVALVGTSVRPQQAQSSRQFCVCGANGSHAEAAKSNPGHAAASQSVGPLEGVGCPAAAPGAGITGDLLFLKAI